MRTKDVLEFWGKARPESEAGVAWHPVAYHLLDVAAVADALLKARPQTAQRADWLLGLQPEEARQVLVSLISIHDLGKFAPRFQQLATPLGWSWPSALTGLDASRLEPTVHTADGLLLWRKVLRAEFTQRIWVNGESAIDALECAIYGHHGRPVELASGPLAVFPAHAGMIRFGGGMAGRSGRVPRACGDDPTIPRVYGDASACSPRMRG